MAGWGAVINGKYVSEVEDIVHTKKIINFLKKSRYEKIYSIHRNLYSYINKRKFVSIGKKSYFMKPIFLSGTKYMEIGEDAGIWHHARVEVIDSWHDQTFTPKLKIGNHVNIGQNLHLTCAESVIIEDNVVCSARVMITDISHVTEDLNMPVLEQALTTKPVRICEGAFIGLNASIMPGVTIGKHAIVGLGAVVTHDVPDYATVVGIPAKIVKERGIIGNE